MGAKLQSVLRILIPRKRKSYGSPLCKTDTFAYTCEYEHEMGAFCSAVCRKMRMDQIRASAPS